MFVLDHIYDNYSIMVNWLMNYFSWAPSPLADFHDMSGAITSGFWFVRIGRNFATGIQPCPWKKSVIKETISSRILHPQIQWKQTTNFKKITITYHSKKRMGQSRRLGHSLQGATGAIVFGRCVSLTIVFGMVSGPCFVILVIFWSNNHCFYYGWCCAVVAPSSYSPNGVLWLYIF